MLNAMRKRAGSWIVKALLLMTGASVLTLPPYGEEVSLLIRLPSRRNSTRETPALSLALAE